MTVREFISRINEKWPQDFGKIPILRRRVFSIKGYNFGMLEDYNTSQQKFLNSKLNKIALLEITYQKPIESLIFFDHDSWEKLSGLELMRFKKFYIKNIDVIDLVDMGNYYCLHFSPENFLKLSLE